MENISSYDNADGAYEDYLEQQYKEKIIEEREDKILLNYLEDTINNFIDTIETDGDILESAHSLDVQELMDLAKKIKDKL